MIVLDLGENQLIESLVKTVNSDLTVQSPLLVFNRLVNLADLRLNFAFTDILVDMIYVGGQLPKIYIFIDLWFILDMGLLQIPVEISGFQHNLTALVCQFIRVVNLRVDAFRRQFIQFQLLRTFLPRLIWENNRLLFRLSCLIHDLDLDWRSFLKNYSLNVRDRRTPKVSIPVTPHNWKLNRWRNSCGLNC